MMADGSESELQQKIFSAIIDIRLKKKRPDKNAVICYLEKKFDSDVLKVDRLINELLEEGQLFLKNFEDGRESLFVVENIISGENIAEKQLAEQLLAESTFTRSSVSNEITGDNTSIIENHVELTNQLNNLTTLLLEKERSFSELFYLYREERVRNIRLADENKELSIKLLGKNANFALSSEHISTFAHTESPITNTQQQNISASTQTHQNFSNDGSHEIQDLFSENNPVDHLEISDVLLSNLETVRRQKHNEFMQLSNKSTFPQTISALTPTCQILETPLLKNVTFQTPLAAKSNIAEKTKCNKPARSNNKAHEWIDGTVLIVGDSMIGGLEERKMKAAGNIKVRSHPGANGTCLIILEAHLIKKTSEIVLHITTNNTPNQTSDEILNEIIDLDTWIETKMGGES